jgi:hypothetical protein
MPNAGVVLLLAAMFTVVSCTTSDPVSPADRSSSIIVKGKVRVTLTVTPEVTDPPGVVVATLTYRNTGRQPVTLTSTHSCISFASVYLGSQHVSFPATHYGCFPVITTRTLTFGSPIIIQWPLVIGGEEGSPVPSGTYRFVAKLNTHPENLERTFIVR